MSRSALPPFALLVGYGLAVGGAALGHGLLVLDDHPGQIMRLWHAVTFGVAPWRWSPAWWAGYPELQFYPPGFSYLGALAHALAAGALPPERIYQGLLWLTLLLPGVATFLLLARALGSGWLALPGAFLALTISAETRSGLEEGLRWGLVAARLGWGLLPLLGLSVLRWVEGAPAPPLTASLLLAAVILTHPAHAPGACAMVVLAAGLSVGPAEERARRALVALALGLALSAFWLLPLLARLPMALPLAWGDASPSGLARRLVDYPLLGVLAAGNVAAWVWHARRAPADRTLAWLLALAPVSVALVAADTLLAALGARWLPADRVADTAVLALIVGASVGLAGAARLMPAIPSWTLGLGAVAVALALAAGRDEPALSPWPFSRQWPAYDEVVRGTRLDDLWSALRQAPAGRILFVRSSVPLEYRPEWWRPHSHISALTPMRTGRDIINGTFTHPSPVAGFVYSGSASAPITQLVERRDGVTLFGRPLGALRPADLERVGARLRISAVVALDEDAGRLGFVAGHPDFDPPRRIGPFLLFVSRAPRAMPSWRGPDRLRVSVDGPGASRSDAGWSSAGIAYSPLWRAQVRGEAVRTRRGGTGLLEVETPGGDVDLAYRPGAAEWAGLALSAGALAALAVIGRRRRARRPGARAAGYTSGS